MSGSASIDLERSLLQHSLAIAPMAALSRVYVALCLTPPTETAGGTEASGGGYARTAATFALMSSPANAASNAASVEFLAATSAWGTIGYFEIWTAATGGTRLYWGPLTDPVDGVQIEMDVATGDVVRFSAGALIVQTADALTAAGGPFLPLSGGTLGGPLVVEHSGTANRLTIAPPHPSAAYVPGSSQMFSYLIAAAGGGNRFDVVSNSQFYSSITGAPNTRFQQPERR